MAVIVPSDAIETRKMTEYITDYEGPVYMRINKESLPLIFNEKWEFELGKLYEVRKGNDAVVFANGIMVSKALSAASLLEKEDISIKVMNVSTVKPLNKEEIIEIL